MIARLLELPEHRPRLVITLVGLLFALAYCSSAVLRPKPNGRVVSGDALHHYVQLRSAVFDRDLHFRNEYVRLYDLRGGEHGSEWVFEDTATGHVRNLMPVGPAIVWTPLFVLTASAVWLADLFGASYPLDGYGRLFQVTAGVSGIAAASLGMWLSYAAAARLFSARASIWALLAMWLASSAIYYSLISPTYSHAASILTSSTFWLAWIVMRPGPRRYAALGALAGASALMRWQDAILLAPVALDLIFAVRGGRIGIVGAVRYGILTLVCAAAAFAPQMFVWTALYGRPLAMPQGADFMRWTEPALASVLFSDFHGLFTWTPIAAIAVAGLVPLWKREPVLAAGAALFLGLSWYVNAAVVDWWAGEAFGARRFLSCFPVMTLGLAAIAERFKASLGWLAAMTGVVVAHTFLLLVQYQAFMHGVRDVVPYPRGAYNLHLARFVVPIDLLRKVFE